MYGACTYFFYLFPLLIHSYEYDQIILFKLLRTIALFYAHRLESLEFDIFYFTFLQIFYIGYLPMNMIKNSLYKSIRKFVSTLLHTSFVCLEDQILDQSYLIFLLVTGAHLGFSEGRGPNFRKGANQYKTNKKRI